MQGVTESDHENAQCDWAYRGCRVIDSSASLASPVTEHCRVILGQRCFPYRTTANSVERCRRSTKGISPRISRCSLRSHRRLRHWVVLQRLQLSRLLRTIELWIQWLRLSELLRTVLRVWLWAVLRRLWILHRTPLQAGDFSASGVALLVGAWTTCSFHARCCPSAAAQARGRARYSFVHLLCHWRPSIARRSRKGAKARNRGR